MEENGSVYAIPGSNIPIAALGALIYGLAGLALMVDLN